MKSLLVLIWIFVFTIAGFSQEWERIIPLKSNRADVEKILGQSNDKNCRECKYSIPSAELVVFYSLDKCKGQMPGWNVASDTVLSFYVSPKEKTVFDESKIDKKKWIGYGFDTLNSFYAEPVKGIKYDISADGKIEDIYYAPSVKDNYLRCKEFPPYNLASASIPPSQSYGDSDIEYGKTAMRAYLKNRDLDKDVKIYVIMYSGSDISPKDYKNYVQVIRNYVYRTMHMSPKKVEITEGGRKKYFGVEIYYLPKSYPPPMPFTEIMLKYMN